MIELKTEFEGKGEVKGTLFKQIRKHEKAYLYELTDIETGQIRYEVFEPVYNKRFDCISYPGSKSFGKTAWCYNDTHKAIEKYRILIGE
jgi:hypothetical protein